MTHEAISRSTTRSGRALRAGMMAAVASVAMALAPALAEAAAPPKPACYSRKEYAAEQLVRLHTEMMVIGLTCQSIFPEEKSFSKYQEFTVKNRPMISEAESSLIGHFQRTGGAGTSRFDTYRTELANEVSRRVGVIGSWSYCQQFLPRSTNAVALSSDDVKTLVSNEKDAGVMHLGKRPLCDVKIASLPDSVGKVEPPRGKAQPTKVASAKPAASAKAALAKHPAPAKAATKPAAAKKPPVKAAGTNGKVAVAQR